METKELTFAPAVDWAGSGAGPVVGRIAGFTADGAALVDFPGNTAEPRPARTTVTLERPTQDEPVLVPVLLVFENGDPSLPIIIGLVRETAAPAKQGGESREVRVDGERVVIEGQKEVVLRCGESAIVLRRDGKVIIRGAEITSRAKRSNKLKGATVHIN